MLYRAMVLHGAGVGRIEALQVFIDNEINQSVSRIVGHIINIGVICNHHFRRPDKIIGGIKA